MNEHLNEISIFTYSLKTDVFLYEELNVLAKKFKKINLFFSRDDGSPSNYNFPPNVEVHDFRYQGGPTKFSLGLFLKALLHEMRHKKYMTKYLLRPRYYFAYFNNAYSRAQALFEYMQSKNINPNSIFYTYWFEDWTFQLSLLKAEHKIKTLISRIHGGDVYEYQHQEADFFFPFRNFQIHCLNKIVGISDDGLKHIKQNYPDSAEKLALSRLGTKDYGLCPINSGAKEFVLVSCSSFYHFKNVTLIPKILALLKFRLHWIHIGNEGPELDAVMEAVKKLPEGISTEFKGQLSPKAVFEFYKQTPVDLFINTSISEGLPVSLMEAISFGIPIVAPNVGGIKEITNDKTGILFDLKTSPAELAAVISKIHNGTIVFDRMAVRKFWEENYHAEKNHNSFSEQLEQLLCAG